MDISDLQGDAMLKDGRVKHSFPLPNGQIWGREKNYLYVGSPLKRVKIKIHKESDQVKGITFIGYKAGEKVKEEESGRSYWLWNREKYINEPAQQEEKKVKAALEQIEELYKREFEGEQKIDITDFLGESSLKGGHVPKDLPLPNGQVWRKSSYFKVGNKLNRVEFSVKKINGAVVGITFIGYKKDVEQQEAENIVAIKKWLEFLKQKKQRGTNSMVSAAISPLAKLIAKLDPEDLERAKNIAIRQIKSISAPEQTTDDAAEAK